MKMTAAALCLALAYVMFSGPMVPAPGSGSLICYPTGRLFMPEECARYSGPDIKIPDDI